MSSPISWDTSFCFRWQHNREREKKATDTDELEGQRGKHTQQEENKTKREKEVKRPVKDGENTGICWVNFDIILWNLTHSPLGVLFSPWSICMHLTGWKNWRGSFASWHCSYRYITELQFPRSTGLRQSPWTDNISQWIPICVSYTVGTEKPANLWRKDKKDATEEGEPIKSKQLI